MSGQGAVLIVSYNRGDLLLDCFRSVLQSECEIVKIIVVVDNGSTDGTPADVRARFPGVHLVESRTNLGFAEANNRAWRYAREHLPNLQFVSLLNQDTVVENGWLERVVRFLEENPNVGIVQSKLRLLPQKERINTAGNRCHFLGFGFVTGYGEADVGQFDGVRPIDFASGAALTVRAELLEQVGLFRGELFMYLEDMELCWRARLLGYDVCLVPGSVVYHHYRPDAAFPHYYLLERNRWLLLLTYYKLSTLLLLAPALLAMEAGQWFFAWRRSLLRDRLKVYRYFWKPRHLRMLWERRREAQRCRTIGDFELIGRFSGTIEAEAITGPVLRWIANPLLGLYWSVARRLIFW